MESVIQSGLCLLNMGHQVEVLTLDDSRSDFIDSYGLPVFPLGPSKGSYQYNSKLVPWLQSHANEYDAVIINGLWQYHSFGAWRVLCRMKVPYFVFTHGMLDPWFKYAYPIKHIKKWIYWPFAEYRVLKDASAVFFTCEEEKVLALKSFWLYKVREHVINFGTKAPPHDREVLAESFYEIYPELHKKRLLLFLSRIQEKKGCDILIQAFAKVAAKYSNLHLVIAGPNQNNHQEKLQTLAEDLGISERISWTGMLQGDIKWGAFYASEAYVLPSHQENFGISVVEALGCGIPVLISNKINIWREIEFDNAGIVNADTVAGTEKTLRQWLAFDNEQRYQMGVNSRCCFEKRFTVDVMAHSIVSAIKKWKQL